MSLVLRLMALAFAMNSAPHSAEACDPNDVRSGVVQSALEASIDAEYDAYPGAKITARGIELSIKGDPSELPSIHAAYRGMRARGAKREGNLTLLAHELFLRRAAVRALAPFEPRKDSITLSLRSTASSRSVRGRMVNLTAEELTLEIDGQPVVIRLTDIDHRSVKGIGADRGSLFSRAPGGTIERNFFQNALEAGSFFRGWFGSARNVDAASLTEAMHRMHEISARGEKGDRPYQVVDAEGMGYETDKIRVGSFRELDFTLIYEGADVYAQEIAGLLRLGSLPGERPGASVSHDLKWTTVAGTRLEIPGIPRESLPVTRGQRHSFPSHNDIPKYVAQGARLLNEVQELRASRAAPEQIHDKIGEYYYVMINSHAYWKINHSLLMNQVNVMLQATGHAGVPQGWIDYLAYWMDYSQFKVVFRNHLDGKIPPPSQPIRFRGSI